MEYLRSGAAGQLLQFRQRLLSGNIGRGRGPTRPLQLQADQDRFFPLLRVPVATIILRIVGANN